MEPPKTQAESQLKLVTADVEAFGIILMEHIIW